MRHLVLGLSVSALVLSLVGCDSFHTVGFLDRRDTTLPGGNGATAQVMALGEFDGDGKIDAAVVSSRNEVNIFISKGDGFFATGSAYAVQMLNGGPRSIAIGELNGDQFSDVVVANGQNRNLDLFYNAGDGRLMPFGGNPVDAGCQLQGVALGDLDGDGAQDIVVGCTNPNEVRVLKNRGGTNGFDVSYVVAAGTGQIPTPRQVAVADLDGNMQPDIVLGTDNDLRILANPGGGASPQVSIPLNMRAGALALGDVNGNKIPDVSVLVNSQEIRVYEYATGGTFSQLVAYQNIGMTMPTMRMPTQALGVGDFLKRGRGDFVVTLPMPSEVKLVVNRNESNSVVQPTSTSYQFPMVQGAVNLNVSDYDLAVGDVTGDGLPDIVLRNNTVLSVLVNASL